MAEQKRSRTADFASKAVFDKDGKPKKGFASALSKAMDINRPAVLANLKRLKQKNPDATPEELAKKLERHYLSAVTLAGGGIGALAFVPGVGTIASMGFSVVSTVAFLEASAFYAQSIAELHGLHEKDPKKTKTVVMAIMLGDEGARLMSQLAGPNASAGTGWVQKLAGGGGASKSAGGVIGMKIRRAFVRRFIIKQGGAMFGRALPFGLGAVIGGGANLAMGRSVIKSTHEAFGPLPDTIDGELVEDLKKVDAQEITARGRVKGSAEAEEAGDAEANGLVEDPKEAKDAVKASKDDK